MWERVPLDGTDNPFLAWLNWTKDVEVVIGLLLGLKELGCNVLSETNCIVSGHPFLMVPLVFPFFNTRKLLLEDQIIFKTTSFVGIRLTLSSEHKIHLILLKGRRS